MTQPSVDRPHAMESAFARSPDQGFHGSLVIARADELNVIRSQCNRKKAMIRF